MSESQTPAETMDTPRETTPTWLAEGVMITRGRILLAVLVAFSFMGFALWAAVETIKELRQDDCEIQMEAIDADRDIWISIDQLIPGGIPEPTRGSIFNRIQQRQDLIETTYGCDRPDFPIPDPPPTITP